MEKSLKEIKAVTYSTTEAGRILGTSRCNVVSYIKKGYLRATGGEAVNKEGGRGSEYRVDPESVQEFLKNPPIKRRATKAVAKDTGAVKEIFDKGGVIIKILDTYNVTRNQVANAIGLGFVYFCMVIDGKSPFTREVSKALEKEFDIPMTVLDRWVDRGFVTRNEIAMYRKARIRSSAEEMTKQMKQMCETTAKEMRETAQKIVNGLSATIPPIHSEPVPIATAEEIKQFEQDLEIKHDELPAPVFEEPIEVEPESIAEDTAVNKVYYISVNCKTTGHPLNDDWKTQLTKMFRSYDSAKQWVNDDIAASIKKVEESGSKDEFFIKETKEGIVVFKIDPGLQTIRLEYRIIETEVV